MMRQPHAIIDEVDERGNWQHTLSSMSGCSGEEAVHVDVTNFHDRAAYIIRTQGTRVTIKQHSMFKQEMGQLDESLMIRSLQECFETVTKESCILAG